MEYPALQKIKDSKDDAVWSKKAWDFCVDLPIMPSIEDP
jgi:hypothetical protein